MSRKKTFADISALAGRTPVLRQTLGRLIRPLAVNREAMHQSLFFRLAGRRVPLCPVVTASGQLTGKSVRQMFTDPEAMVETVSAAIFRFELDAMMIVADLTVDTEAMGCELRFPENELPSVRTHPVKTLDDIRALKPTNPHCDGRMPVILESIRGLTKKFSLLMGSGSCGPFTAAAELAGVEDFALKTITEPDFVARLMDYTTSQIIRYNRAQAEAGSGVIMIGEPSASILSPKAYERFAQPCMERIIQSLDCPVVLHICGDARHLVGLMSQCGAAALSFDAPVDLAWAAEQVPETMIIAGNLDPVSVMYEKSPEGVALATRGMLESMRGKPYYIPASGCDLMPDTPLENIDAFFQTVKQFR